jgi:hypothetical protein
MSFSRKKLDHSVIQYKKEDKKDVLNKGKRKKK